MNESERTTLCRRIDELCAENERLRQENQSIGMAAYDIGYRNGSVHYELEYCPACKNIADLQEALEENAKLREEVEQWHRLTAGIELPEYPITEFKPKDLERENAKLRELVRDIWEACPTDGYYCIYHCEHYDKESESHCKLEARMRELGIEVGA